MAERRAQYYDPQELPPALDGLSVIAVGGGILGVAAALGVARLGARTRVFADQTHGTLSQKINGGLIEPYASLDPRLPGWFKTTLRVISQWAEVDLRRWVRRREALLYSRYEENALPSWHDSALTFQYPVTSPLPTHPFAARFTTFTVRPEPFMGLLNDMATAAGVQFESRHVDSLADLIQEEQPDAVIAAAGLGMSHLWPDPQLGAGVGVVRVCEVPDRGVDAWLDSADTIVGDDLRQLILMNGDLPAYSIPRESKKAGFTQLVIGGTNELREPAAGIEFDEHLAQIFERNVADGLPPVYSQIASRFGVAFRVGARPVRPMVQIDLQTRGGIPVLALGGVAGSGLSIFAGVVGTGIALLLEELGCYPAAIPHEAFLWARPSLSRKESKTMTPSRFPSTRSVGVIFGGRSVEHDVSVITGHQVMEALAERYDVVPIYVTREGDWLTGAGLADLRVYKDRSWNKIAQPAFIPPIAGYGGLMLTGKRLRGTRKINLDVVIPANHGSHGEDGSLQGLFELADLPYAGSGVLSSAAGMDKLVMKTILKEAGLRTIPHLAFDSRTIVDDKTPILRDIEARFEYPCVVKPAALGSSVGVEMVTDRPELAHALDVACYLDRRVLVEEAIVDCVEVNCAVIGGGDHEARASICEEPLSRHRTGGRAGVLDFADKYFGSGKGGSKADQGMAGQDRNVPALIDDALAKKIREEAVEVFQALDAAGVARIDFFLNETTGETWVIEINTAPGSFSSYLWQGETFVDVLSTMIEIALERHKAKARVQFTHDSGLLEREILGPKLGE